ncbi:Vacuolar protein sorting-associated protein Ist1 protein [Dioscorea alata]|uniref:Vacuolar protein sorting-associated protein Ist1 protein n=1 Tax=Dioscorea alata TaxID=55571 RepID=A0ACB7W740_DIOAL|nr:Vacuolar protein sorting-associated protein Ist1 protein [Dioscorea alata]
MGKTLDVIFGRTTRQTAKLKALLELCVQRITFIGNQHRIQCLQSRGDILQLLKLGYRDRAIARAEQAIKEQNVLDVFVMIEGYCHLLHEKATLLEHKNECPDELREAISSLIFAASRSGELPELQDVRRMFAEKFGREFSSDVVELHGDFHVNQKMIQKFSKKHINLETKLMVVIEIAEKEGIEINLEGLRF